MMGRKGIISVLAIIACLLLSEHGAKGQTTEIPVIPVEETTAASTTVALVFESSTALGSVIGGHSCPSYAGDREAICSAVTGTSDITTFLKTVGNSVDCSHSMLQYGCASFEGVTPITCAAVFECFLPNSMAVTSQESFSLITSQLSVDTLGATLSILNNKIPSASISEPNKKYLLNAVVEKLIEAPGDLSPGFVATWFQEKLFSYVPVIDITALDCIASLPMSCDSFESMAMALDVSYSTFDQSKKEQIGSWITRFISTHSCMKGSTGESIKAYYRSFLANVEIISLSTSWSLTELGSSIESLTDFQLAQYVGISNSFSSYETATSILQYIGTKEYNFIFNFLSHLEAKNYGQEIASSLLSSAIIRLEASDDPLCRPKLKTLFQAKFSYLFIGINRDILNLISPGDCSDYQDVYGALDTVYSLLSEENQGLLYEYRYNYLTAEALKSGSACTYGLSSSQWFQLNLGMSSDRFSYADIISFYSGFDGYEAFSLLSITQTMDLFIASEIFTSASPKDAETRISSVISVLKTKGYVYLQSFFIEFKVYLVRFNIQFITNITVRRLFLQGVWGILEERFAQFSTNDWYIWYNEYLTILLPSISVEQISVLSHGVVEDCSNLGSVVGGFDSQFAHMDEETKSVVANWIVGFLKNDDSKCIQAEGNWLVTTFKQFKQYVSVTIVKELNPDFNLLESLAEFTATQIGEVVFSEESALSNVTVIEKIFSFLIVENDNKKTVEKMGEFWDSFNLKYEEVSQFTNEVKETMLILTTDEISLQYIEFTTEEWTLWWGVRLRQVTTVVTEDTMQQVPMNISCGSYKAVAQSLSNNYEETLETSQNVVYSFMVSYFTKGTKCSDSEVDTKSFLETSMGSYSVKSTYEELIVYYPAFDVFEEGVIQKLTEVQIGDMMVVANVYESQEHATKVVEYLQTLTIEKVDICFTQFTETAIKKNVIINNFSVGQYILESYLTILKTKLVTYTHTEIIQLFEYKITFFIKFISKTILRLFIVDDCGTLVVFVNQLDKGFSSMTEETKKDVASWIIECLGSLKLNGCGSIAQTTSEWSQLVMKSFISAVSISEIKKVYSSFDVTSVMNYTSVSQKVEYVFSNEEVLVTVDLVRNMLGSMNAVDNVVTTSEIYSFCSEFNAKYETLTVKYMSYEVQQEIFTFFFTSWIQNLNSMTEVEISQFGEYFYYFLSGVNEAALSVISENMNCNGYQVIFSSFSSVMDTLSEENEMLIFEAMIKYLDAQSTGSSDVCGSLYTDSRTYVTNIYYGFFIYVKYYQMISYYREFDAYTVLDLCSGEQLGNLFINSTAIRNQLEASQIIVELQKREYTEISSFMSECTRVANEKGITSLPNANIEDMLYTGIWDKVSENLKTEDDYKSFSSHFTLIISSISSTAINSLKVSDCNSQRYLVEAFSKGFDKQDEDQKESVYGKIKEFNQEQKVTAGSACKTESGTSSEWVHIFYGNYVEKASYEEFKEYNSEFSAADSLDVLSGTQVAQYVIESQILRQEEEIVIIYESMHSKKKVEEFLVELNGAAPEELRNSPYVSLIMSRSMTAISEEISTFTEVDYTYLFQEVFRNILFAIDVTDIKRFFFPLSCASYQALLKGFDNVYDQMTEETRKNVYDSCIRAQLNSAPVVNGVRCGQNIVRTQEWVDVNMKRFSTYGDITEYEQWNSNFKNTDIIDTASPEQLGVIAVETIEREEVACQIAGVVQQFGYDEASSFLESFSAAFQTSNAKIASGEIGYKFLSSSVTAMKSAFGKYSSSDWENLFSLKLKPFLFSMNAEVLSSILASADCSGYFIIVKYLDLSYDDFSDDIKPQFAGVLTDYLKRQPSGTCPMSGDSSVVTFALFGRYTNSMGFEDFSSYVQNFDGLQAIDLLSASQQGSLAFTGDILNNEGKANILVDSIKKMSFGQLDLFLASFQSNAEAKNVAALSNVQVRDLMFNALYDTVSKQFSSFTDDQWSLYFSRRFSYFLPSITEQHIGLIPNSINCNAYQSFIAGCSQQYSKLSGSAQKAIADKAKSYLSFNKPDFGPKCPPRTGGSGAWLDSNFALFSDYCSTTEIASLYPGFVFTDAVEYLTAEQIGSLASSPEYLSNKDKTSKLLNGITSVTLGEFLNSFNGGLALNGITQISNAQIRKFFLGEICCKLESILSSFSDSDYSLWFGTKLKQFLISFDAKAFGFIPTDISCGSLAAIMEAFNALENPENPEAIFNFAYSVLEAQKASSGVACTSASVSSGEWFTKYFGKYSSQASWEQISTVYPTIVLMEVKSFLTASQLASASSTVISNTGDFMSFMMNFTGTMDDFYDYMDSLQNILVKNPDLAANSKVKEILLMMVGNVVFTSFGDFDVPTTQKWMNKISFLLPSINSTMMQMFPYRMSCEQYRVILGALGGAYQNLSPAKRQDIANYEKAFLLNKLSTDSDSCSIGLNAIDYIVKNVGPFCKQFNAEDITSINSAIEPVSFKQVCDLS